jgi:hypothetical protein
MRFLPSVVLGFAGYAAEEVGDVVRPMTFGPSVLLLIGV